MRSRPFAVASFRRPARVVLSRVVLCLALASVLCACGVIQPVAPWEKGMLAKPDMTFENDRLDAAFQEHTYSSKEAAAGGAGVGGGGCGCN